ncbi:MAG: sulfur carrier protein ThiS [Phycisphaerales bacterium JB043]
MRVTINDAAFTLDDDSTIEHLLSLRGLDDKPCAVEVNRVLVPKREHASRTLSDGDVVEIVTLVGGG